MGKLRDSMEKYMVLRGYSESTITSYLTCVNIFAQHYKQSPLKLSSQNIIDFVIHLRKIGKRETTIYMYYSSLKLFYKINKMDETVAYTDLHGHSYLLAG